MDDIYIKTRVRLSNEEVLSLLNYFDDSSDRPLHEGLDFDSYSKKLSEHALFVLCYDATFLIGFIAYYLNKEKNYVYVPQIVVHHKGRHLGIGHKMLTTLIEGLTYNYNSIQLEVLKSNTNAYKFYEREGFKIIEDHENRWLLKKLI